MYVKTLELTGFKSFAEAKIEFPKGITAVVGPNGAGKSNVVDAILWVLGEQSTKTLRSERMEDVIFNGTETRKPLGMVEVSLIMSGIDEGKRDGLPALPNQLGEYHEVMVTRRLYRNGDSEYLINKTLCRLKDIRSLFMDTRAGSKGHTVIEQGRLDHILNASPQERRELIEETAGIVRYKKQKGEALRKLDATQQNLLRVRDIIVEVQRQLTSLERQARQAQTYQTLHRQARTIEVRVLTLDYRARTAACAVVETELASLETRESGQVAEQARLIRDLEEVRLRMTSADHSVSRIREELARVEHQQAQAVTAMEVERGRLELYEQQRRQALEELAHLGLEREQAARTLGELEARLSGGEASMAERARALAELEQAAQHLAARRTAFVEEEELSRRACLAVTVEVTNEQNNQAGLQGRREEVRRRGERLAAEQADAAEQHRTVSDRLQEIVQDREAGERQFAEVRARRDAATQEGLDLEARRGDLDHAISQEQAELAAVESRLQALQGMVREEMGYGREGEEETTSLRALCHGVREAVAEWLVVPPGLERAIEAALGERVRAWLVEGPSDARPAIEFLKSKHLGRGAFVPIRPRRSAGAAGPQAGGRWSALQREPGVLGCATDLLRTSGGSPDALNCLFEDIVLVDTLETAIHLWEGAEWPAAEGPTLITLEGERLDAAGVLTSGIAGETDGLLQRRRATRDLEVKRGTLSGVLEDRRRVREQLLVAGEASRAEVQRLDEAIREAELRALASAKEEAGLEQQVEALSRRIETVRTERSTGEEEQVVMEIELKAGQARLARAAEETTVREARLAEAREAMRKIEEEGHGLQQRTMDVRLAVAELRARFEHDKAELTRTCTVQDEQASRAVALDRQVHALAASTQRSQAEGERNEALFQELERQAVRVKEGLIAAQEAQARDAEIVRHVEGALAAVREELEASRSTRTAIEVRRAEIKTQLAALEQTLTGTYQMSAEEALASVPDTGSHGDGENEAAGASEEGRAALQEQLQKTRDRLSRLGAVNLAAIEEHQALEERHRFLTTQEQDLSHSISSLKEIISRINRTTKQMFLETFNELQQKFGEVFARFFAGGRAELVLTESQEGQEPGEASPDEPGVDIVVQPPGKRLKNITMLSGGEKTLTAMALIFASFLIRPTPFCILDEIDAPLDEENIGRFTGVLRDLAQGAQFVVITHNKRTMAVADSLFGVTMEEPGTSKLVSVRLADLQPA